MTNLERARKWLGTSMDAVWLDYRPHIIVGLATLLDQVEKNARLDEAKWWIRHLEENGDEVLDSDRAHIAELEAKP